MEIVRENHNVEIICHSVRFKPAVSSLHWHDKYELCRVDSESCKFLVDGEQIEAGRGDIIAINESALHRFIIERQDTDVCICQFPVKILFGFTRSVKPLKKHIKAEELAAIPDLAENVNSLLSMMERDAANGTEDAGAFLRSLAAAVYSLLASHFSESCEGAQADRELMEFYKVTEYLNEHFKEPLTVDTVSKSLYLSRGRLSALFTRFAGEGINSYINNLRIKHANLLMSRGSSITDAAYESGFQSIRTFNNVYKTIMNITPSEYLNKKKVIVSQKT